MTPMVSRGMRQYYGQNPGDNPFGSLSPYTPSTTQGPGPGVNHPPRMGDAAPTLIPNPMPSSQGPGPGVNHPEQIGSLAYAQAGTLRRPTYYQPQPSFGRGGGGVPTLTPSPYAPFGQGPGPGVNHPPRIGGYAPTLPFARQYPIPFALQRGVPQRLGTSYLVQGLLGGGSPFMRSSGYGRGLSHWLGQ